jgi:crotonobetainyl-CoA:carnitine CoA-transferase CaiB-like acyl-CoA transferase
LPPLYERQRTGEGRLVECSLLETAIGFSSWTSAQWLADPQVRHRGLVQYASDPELCEVPHIRTPVRIGEGVRVRNVAPELGQHNAEIFGRLGLGEAELQRLQGQVSSDRAAT